MTKPFYVVNNVTNTFENSFKEKSMTFKAVSVDK